MSNRLIALLGFLAVIVLFYFLPSWTRKSSSNSASAISQRIEEKETQTDDLRSAMRYLGRMTPQNRDLTIKEVRLALNTWLEKADVSAANYASPKTLTGLEPEMLASVGCSSNIALTFDYWDVDYLFQCRLMSKISDWVVDEPLGDSLIRPILAKYQRELEEQEYLKLEEAYKLFDWAMRNVGLDPEMSSVETKSPNPAGKVIELGPGYSYLPWESLLFCTGDFIEKGRVFTALAAQREINTGWVVDAGKIWAIGVLIGGEIYLFEPKLALPILEPDELRFATLEEAKKNPRILRRLDLPGRFDYAFNPGDLNFLELFVDQPPVAASARMKLLEQNLLGEERMKVYQDIDALVKNFQTAAPKATVKVWDLPLKAQFHALQIRDKLRITSDFTQQYRMVNGNWMWDSFAAQGRMRHLSGKFKKSSDGKQGAFALYMKCRLDAETLKKLEWDPDMQKAFGMEKQPDESKENHKGRLMSHLFDLRRAKVDATMLAAQLHFDRGNYLESINWFQQLLNNDKPQEQLFAKRWENISRYGIARSYQELGDEAKFNEYLTYSSPAGQAANPHEAGNRLRLRYLKDLNAQKAGAE
ncbi:MAG: hypothetical protein VXZ82_16365 [Planctomycetota bacterium]|nr:hypothetical protein [Planctomycetota bacterium]